MSLPIYLFILIELLCVSYLDLKTRKIKNIWSLLNLVVAFICFLAFPKQYIFALESFQFTFVIFVVGFILFMLKIMGGGDSKFLASFFLMVPSRSQDLVFAQLLIGTVVIGLIVLVRNIVKNHEKLIISLKESDLQGVKSCFGTKFPYAPVILLSWLLFGYSVFL